MLVRIEFFQVLMMLLTIVLTLSLSMPRVYGAGPMDEEPSTQVSRSTTSTKISPSTTGPTCETKTQKPTITEPCTTSEGAYMGIDKDSNLVFSNTVTGLREGFGEDYEPIRVYSIVKSNIELKRQNFDHGIHRGYSIGMEDALNGDPSNPKPPSTPTPFNKGFDEGYKLGYPDGYAAGLFEKNFKN